MSRPFGMARLAFVTLALALSPHAFAQAPGGTQNTSPQESSMTENGRYAMTPAPGGFLRLDTRTGAVALCSVKGPSVTCAASADERGALDAEIDRLSRENTALREKLARATDQAPSARLRNALPTEREMNQALGFAEQFMRRMMRIMRDEAPKGQQL